MRARALGRLSSPARAPLGAALIAAGLALIATACGTGGIAKGGDPTQGKHLFQQKCGACHTLADAGTQGKVGPNLDSAFASDRKQKVGNDSSIQQVVADQIKFAACVKPPTSEQKEKVPPPDNAAAPLVEAGNCMPRNLVTGDDVDSVSAYVALVAGKPVTGGGGGKITATSGKDIFTTAGCTSCHTLKDAGATGTVGPNLDQAKPPKSRVVDRVTNGKGVMPSFKGRLTKQQIDAVAKYVSGVAGK